jgi:hypothetical protein
MVLAGALSAACGGETPGDPIPTQKPARAWFRFDRIDLPGASRTTDFAFVPGTLDEIIAISQMGFVRRYKIAGNRASKVDEGKISGLASEQGCGPLSLAFDPAFATNRFVYIAHCVDLTRNSLVRYSAEELGIIETTGAEILLITNPETPKELWHRWGSMGFEPDGVTLWVLMGDNQSPANGQGTTEKYGSLLRIVPNRTPGGSGFEPAAGNAFTDAAAGDPSVYAYGLRSPWRGSRDRLGRFWIGDVGAGKIEEVNLATRPGDNFGWNLHEGPCKTNCEGLVNPVTSWGRSSDEAYVLDDVATEPTTKRTVWVGDPYEPSLLATPAGKDRYFGYMDDTVVFGDYFTGWVRGVRVAADGTVEVDKLYGHFKSVTAWRMGPDGYMYMLNLAGDLFRVVLDDDV